MTISILSGIYVNNSILSGKNAATHLPCVIMWKKLKNTPLMPNNQVTIKYSYLIFQKKKKLNFPFLGLQKGHDWYILQWINK